MVRVPSRVPSLTLVAAGAALLAPTTPPAAPPPPEPRALSHAPPPSRATAPSHAPPGARVPSRPVARPPLREDGPVRAADLLTAVRDCEPVSRGRFRADAQAAADIPVCGTTGAVFWKADLDIDCDGRPGARCNRRTDPYFTAATACPGSDGRPLDAERLPYIVVPAPDTRWDHRAHGVRCGSVAAVVYRDRVRYAVVGDIGPRGVIGEGSYALAESLGIRTDPRTGGVPSGVTYIVFDDSRAEPVDDVRAASRTGERLARRLISRN
ncbi:glycoside hydrolase family 75 protein [Streptomyces fumanus]|uniref:Secreted protein n=1 Tax=Streptomyces fumanus TaxID=67302 RepID=A0A919ASH5_9ACTN|nr:glycoside hydrolase family 75 protein [Streptomyces fumanus]GHF22812.1 hypothetical protein GCM10018772_55580 [Streptomyces fumanus]